MNNESQCRHQSPAITASLLIVTCGLYSLFLLYQWIKAINAVSTKPNLDPALAIILTIVTCGLASIYFEYEIAERIEKIIQSNKANGELRTDSMEAPISNLKGIVLFGSIGGFALSLFSGGILSILYFIFTIWLCCAIQYSLEYALNTPQD